MGTLNKYNGAANIAVSSDSPAVLETSRDAQFSDFSAGRSRQTLFYLLNTTFFVLISFVAGYNLKAYQVRNAADNIMQHANQYITMTRANYEKSNQLLDDIQKKHTTHFEAAVTVTPETVTADPVIAEESTSVSASLSRVTPVVPDTAPAVSVPAAPSLSKPKPVIPAFPDIRTMTPSQIISYETVYHTIRHGEILSELVPKALIGDFLSNNSTITNPDIIYPGQTIALKIPKQSILNGSYMNRYFIRPVTGSTGASHYYLTPWLSIPNSRSLIGFLISETRNSVKPDSVPYIDLSDYTSTIKEEIFGNDVPIITRLSKIHRISPSQTGLQFYTVKSHDVFQKNDYDGIRLTASGDFDTHINRIKDYIIKYLASVQSGDINRNFFHFFIFDDTIVQTDFLSRDIFTSGSSNSRIRIGLVRRTPKTGEALIRLQRALSLYKISSGDIAEVSRNNFKIFK